MFDTASSTEISSDELANLRRQTPGIQHVAHFNYAGAGLLSAPTLAAVRVQLQHEAELGPVEAGLAVQDQLSLLKPALAQLLGASAQDLALLNSGTQAWLQAFYAMPAWQKGDRILVSRQEWGSNVAAIQQKAKACGAQLEVMPCDAVGAVDIDQLRHMMDERVKLLCLTWLPANGGLINDAIGIGAIARHFDVPYMIDAGQALGQLPIDVQALQCDVLKASTRKHLRGGKGMAVLYLSPNFVKRFTPLWRDANRVQFDAELQASSQPQAGNFELGDFSSSALLGLLAACQQALQLDVARSWRRIQGLAIETRARLAALPDFLCQDLGNSKTGQSGLVSFTHKHLTPLQLQARLATQRIQIGANDERYTPLDMRARGLKHVARISLCYLHDSSDLDHLFETLAQV